MPARSVTWSFDEASSEADQTSASMATRQRSGSSRRGRPPMHPSDTPAGGAGTATTPTTSCLKKTKGIYNQRNGSEGSSSTTSDLAREILAKHAKSLKDSREGAEAWRKYGKLYRAKLIMKDEEGGGNSFSLSNNCRIEKYYEVAERVMQNFLKLNTSTTEADLKESYLVGTRLVKFLSTVLPTHKDYFKSETTLLTLRNRSQAQLVECMQYLEQLSLIIDEAEYNKYILNDLEPDNTKRSTSLSFEEPNTSSTFYSSSINTSRTTSVDSKGTSYSKDTTTSFADESFEIFDSAFFSSIGGSNASTRSLNQSDEASTWDESFALCGQHDRESSSISVEALYARDAFFDGLEDEGKSSGSSFSRSVDSSPRKPSTGSSGSKKKSHPIGFVAATASMRPMSFGATTTPKKLEKKLSTGTSSTSSSLKPRTIKVLSGSPDVTTRTSPTSIKTDIYAPPVTAATGRPVPSIKPLKASKGFHFSTAMTFEEAIPPSREQSPKSPLDFTEWKPEDQHPIETNPNLENLVISKDSSDNDEAVGGTDLGDSHDYSYGSLDISGDYDEEASLTSLTKGNQLTMRKRHTHIQPFRDCIRCLLQD